MCVRVSQGVGMSECASDSEGESGCGDEWVCVRVSQGVGMSEYASDSEGELGYRGE
jgi:hypothetical protein